MTDFSAQQPGPTGYDDTPGVPMDFITSVKYNLQNFAKFSGRASQSQFWWFVLFTFLASFVLGIIAVIPIIGLVAIVAAFALIVPSIAVTVRRARDANSDTTFIVLLTLLAVFVPFVGLLVVGLLPARP